MAGIASIARPIPEGLCQIRNTFSLACSPWEVISAHHQRGIAIPGAFVLSTEEQGRDDEYRLVDVLTPPEAIQMPEAREQILA
jgi:hypothetical protein